MSHKDLNPVNQKNPKRVAIVLSNPAVSTTTNWPAGFWWSELSHPYFRFTELGYQVEIFSPEGGACVADAMSDPEDASQWQAEDVISRGYKHDPDSSACQLTQASAAPTLAASLASFLNYASLAVVGEAGAGASECDGGQADRENQHGADPGTTVGRGADGPGPRVAPGRVQCVLGEPQVAK